MLRNKGIPSGLLEATRLMRAGRLLEATTLIQRTLRRVSAGAEGGNRDAPDHRGDAGNDVIDVEFSAVTAPANRDLAPPQTPAGDEVPQRFARERALPGARGRHSVADAPPRSSTHVDGPPGRFITGSYANHSGARPYKLYIPTTYAGQPLPLIVMLHGCTQTPDDFATGTGMNLIAEERQCLVLYPEQTHAANPSRCWNWFKRGDQRRDRGEPAILAGMTREVMDRYRIDSRRVYVAGMSAGGAMAAVMGTAYPELYAAVGVHSGLACGSAHDLPSALAAMRGRRVAPGAGHNAESGPLVRATPTIVFHGDRDSTVHPRNGEQVALQSAEHIGAPGGDAAIERGQVPGGHAYTRTDHRDPTGRVVLEHWLVHGGGHAWFGGNPRGSHVDPKGPNAAREMIRFFLHTPGQGS